jgi:hypothetical protein
MPSTAGFQLVAGRIPGERIATAVRTSNSSSFTSTETQTDTVTAPLVSGRTYRVTAYLLCRSTVANDTDIARLREDNLTGTTLQSIRVLIPATGAATDTLIYLEAQYTAASSADKTFVATGVRGSGTGSITHTAGTSNPVYLYVDYISG